MSFNEKALKRSSNGSLGNKNLSNNLGEWKPDQTLKKMKQIYGDSITKLQNEAQTNRERRVDEKRVQVLRNNWWEFTNLQVLAGNKFPALKNVVILNEDFKFESKKVVVVDALLKSVFELIDNSIDIHEKSNWEFNQLSFKWIERLIKQESWLRDFGQQCWDCN